MTRMLTEPWVLPFPATGETVDDVEALARGVMGAEGWPIVLEPVDNDELLAFLLGECVVLATVYRDLPGIKAEPWLFQRLRWKARDWRTNAERHRTLPDLPPILDDDGPVDGSSGARGAGIGDGVAGGADAEAAGDRGHAGGDALRRLLEGGDREVLREVEALGLGSPPGARAGARRARDAALAEAA